MAELHFRRDFTAPYGVLETVSPLIRRIVAHNPGPFTFTGTGTYVVGHGTVEEGADRAFVPDQALREGDVVAGPGWHFTAVHTPGHTSNHLCFALAEERALFSGDHVMGWSTSVIAPPDGDMVHYMASLEK